MRITLISCWLKSSMSAILKWKYHKWFSHIIRLILRGVKASSQDNLGFTVPEDLQQPQCVVKDFSCDSMVTKHVHLKEHLTCFTFVPPKETTGIIRLKKRLKIIYAEPNASRSQHWPTFENISSQMLVPSMLDIINMLKRIKQRSIFSLQAFFTVPQSCRILKENNLNLVYLNSSVFVFFYKQNNLIISFWSHHIYPTSAVQICILYIPT